MQACLEHFIAPLPTRNDTGRAQERGSTTNARCTERAASAQTGKSGLHYPRTEPPPARCSLTPRPCYPHSHSRPASHPLSTRRLRAHHPPPGGCLLASRTVFLCLALAFSYPRPRMREPHTYALTPATPHPYLQTCSHRRRLLRLGFQFDVSDSYWNSMFGRLILFKMHFGFAVSQCPCVHVSCPSFFMSLSPYVFKNVPKSRWLF